MNISKKKKNRYEKKRERREGVGRGGKGWEGVGRGGDRRGEEKVEEIMRLPSRWINSICS